MISIINYGMGNIKSIQNALSYLGAENRIIDSAQQILDSKKLILPGVGSFAKAMENIKNMGILDVLHKAVVDKKAQILGICLGMQLFAEYGEEDGPTEGFGWISGRVRKLKAENMLKIPHIGFNEVCFSPHNRALFGGLNERADFYFAHSYVLCCDCESDIASWTDYGEKFVSSIQHGNIFGTQFHPEKSQSNGLVVLRSFATLENYGKA